MPVQLNHHIVAARDKASSAAFFAEILGLGPPQRWGPFVAVELDNDLTLDFMTTTGDINGAHYAFLVSEPEFDEIWGRIKDRGLDFFAEPDLSGKGEINTRDGGRGLYWLDPNGHLLEILTRPYGSGGGS
jgi:catechol 2,3-dioxygenase-like lactoylglutathione lyase family enzyme